MSQKISAMPDLQALAGNEALAVISGSPPANFRVPLNSPLAAPYQVLFHLQVGAIGLGHLHSAVITLGDLQACMTQYSGGNNSHDFSVVSNEVAGHVHTVDLSYHYDTGEISVLGVSTVDGTVLHTAKVAHFSIASIALEA